MWAIRRLSVDDYRMCTVTVAVVQLLPILVPRNVCPILNFSARKAKKI